MKTSELIEELEALGMDDLKHQLFHILAEYAATLIEKREEEKKYQFKIKGIVDNMNFLNYEMIQGFYFLDSITGNQEVQTTFTQSEIDNFPEGIKRLITVAERIPVTE